MTSEKWSNYVYTDAAADGAAGSTDAPVFASVSAEAEAAAPAAGSLLISALCCFF